MYPMIVLIEGDHHPDHAQRALQCRPARPNRLALSAEEMYTSMAWSWSWS